MVHFLKVAPNSSRGLIILFISLFFKDLSPVILITLGEFIKVAHIRRAVVPELFALIIVFFLNEKLFNPLEIISVIFFF